MTHIQERAEKLAVEKYPSLDPSEVEKTHYQRNAYVAGLMDQDQNPLTYDDLMLEQASRAICALSSPNPDRIVTTMKGYTGPEWKTHYRTAEAALQAVGMRAES